MTEQQTPDREKKIAEIREWHEGKRDSFPQFTVFEAVGVMLDEIDRIQQEYAEERAAHNAHVAQLCRAEEENRKRFVKIAELVSQRERLTKENRKLREKRDKLIEGLRSIRNELDRLSRESRQKWKHEGDMYEQGRADAYDEADVLIRDILKECGVTKDA